MNRRRFLGAAAALGGVASAPSVNSTNDSETEDDDQESFSGGRTTITQTAGGYEAINSQNRTTIVNVSKHSECASIVLSDDFVSIDAMLLPEDIDGVIAELQGTKARTNDDEAAEAREWVTERHKETDARDRVGEGL